MAVAMAAATLVPAGPASAASEAASGDVFTFVGGGFGHSVGLSQFGAYGMALEGYEYDAILRHYYTGTTIEPAADEILDEPVWVNLSLERSSMTWTVVQAGSAPASGASLTLGGATLDFSAGDSFTITAIGSNSCRITSGVGTAAGTVQFRHRLGRLGRLAHHCTGAGRLHSTGLELHLGHHMAAMSVRQGDDAHPP